MNLPNVWADVRKTLESVDDFGFTHCMDADCCKAVLAEDAQICDILGS